MLRSLLGCGLLAFVLAMSNSSAPAQDKAASPADAFQVNSVWADVADVRFLDKGKSLTVTAREGEKFKATFKFQDEIEREITGTIKDGKLSWLAKDVRAIKGNAGGDNEGTLGKDKMGDKIDFVWRKPGSDDVAGKFTLRLIKAK